MTKEMNMTTDNRLDALIARPKRDRHPARSARILTTGLSIASTLGLMSALRVEATAAAANSKTPLPLSSNSTSSTPSGFAEDVQAASVPVPQGALATGELAQAEPAIPAAPKTLKGSPIPTETSEVTLPQSLGPATPTTLNEPAIVEPAPANNSTITLSVPQAPVVTAPSATTSGSK